MEHQSRKLLRTILFGLFLYLAVLVSKPMLVGLTAAGTAFSLAIIGIGVATIWFSAEKMLLRSLEEVKFLWRFFGGLVGVCAAAATSGPEGAVNWFALAPDADGLVLVLALGNVVFSNLVNICLLGFQRLLISGVNKVRNQNITLTIDRKLLFSVYLLLGIQAVFLLLCWRGNAFSPADGMTMICLGVIFIGKQIYEAFFSEHSSEKGESQNFRKIPQRGLRTCMAIVIGILGILLLG